jgi:hypothetical protein
MGRSVEKVASSDVKAKDRDKIEAPRKCKCEEDELRVLLKR